jgi:cytoskeletal protein CcmA (bactofilin family)
MWASGKSEPGTAAGQKDLTFMGKDVVFKGILTLEGHVRIDGQVEGEIHSTGTLTVGEEGVIRGNITAGILITSGNIMGNVTASEKIKILKSGVLIGNIRTPAISIEAGAHFHGQSDMGIYKWVEDHGAPSEKIHDLAVQRGRLRAPNPRET